MGDWVYYVGFMSFGQVATHIHIAEDLHSAPSLKELLQRKLSKRAEGIAQYLVSTPQRLFNSIVVGAYGGNTDFLELSVSDNSFPDSLEGSLGLLRFSGTERLFAIDGQHRVAGIKAALEVNEALATEELAVLFVKGVSAPSRAGDPEGFERTRRLFTNLNQHAKTVSRTDIIALDEDNVCAILARELVDEHPIFKNRVSASRSQNLPPSDTKNFTHIAILYETASVILGVKPQRTAQRPSDEKLAEMKVQLFDFWTSFQQGVAGLPELSSAPTESLEAYRSREGGDLLFRPVGLSMFVEAVILLKLHKTDGELADAIAIANRVPRALSAEPWTGVLWDGHNSKMLANSDNKKAARLLLFYSLGLDLSLVKADEKKLLNLLSSVRGHEVKRSTLIKYSS